MELFIFGGIAFILWYLISTKSEIKNFKKINADLLDSNRQIKSQLQKLYSLNGELERNNKLLIKSKNQFEKNLQLSESKFTSTEKLLNASRKKADELEAIITENKIKESLSQYKLNSEMLKFYNEYHDFVLNELEKYFTNKKNPSLKSAQLVNELKKDFKNLGIENRQLKLLISQFIPDEDYDVSETNDIPEELDYENSYKYDKRLSKDEWVNLDPIKKLDVILERSINKRKSKLDIGLEFERYCGYLYEKNGYKVKYYGILNGLSDGGIDLIAENKIKKIYIQCKYWGNNKIIRENTISQLLGSSLSLAISQGESTDSFFEKVKEGKIKMAVLTKAKLSEEAKEFCKKLNILFKENMEIEINYPRVKLVEGDEKIFYIPTDQQYDNICFGSTPKNYSRTLTCEEAFKLGYRHSYKWRGSNN